MSEPVSAAYKLPRAPLVASAWCVACPACNIQIEVEDHEWHEAASGWIEAIDAARYPVCEHCGLQFEVASVFVMEDQP